MLPSPSITTGRAYQQAAYDRVQAARRDLSKAMDAYQNPNFRLATHRRLEKQIHRCQVRLRDAMAWADEMGVSV